MLLGLPVISKAALVSGRTPLAVVIDGMAGQTPPSTTSATGPERAWPAGIPLPLRRARR